MIKLVVSTKIVFSFLFLFLSTSSFAQIIDKFNHENFTVEIKKEFLSTSEQLYDPFVIETAISNWNNKLNEEEKHMFLRIVNYLNYNDQRNYFSYLKYFNSLYSLGLLGNTPLIKLLTYNYYYMVNSKDGTNYFDRLLNNIENKILVKESSHKLSHNSQFTIEVDDFSAYSLFDDQGSTVGTLVFKFFNADISYHSEYEIFKIEQTTFNFYPDINIVEGVSGKITSYVDNNYLGDVDYSLNAFSIELEEGRILANNTILNSDRLKGIKGTFDYIPPKKSPKSKNNFSFISNNSEHMFVLEDKAKFKIGVSIKGDDFHTKSLSGDVSELLILLEGGKKIKIKSNSFSVTNDKIYSLDSFFGFYNKSDSLFHPSAEVTFDSENRKIEVLNLNGILKNTPFYSSYFKIELKADFLYYNLGENIMSFGMIVAPHQRPVVVYSTKYYSDRTLNELTDLNGINILKAVYTYYKKTRRKDFFIGDLAYHLKTKSNLLEGGVISLWRKGFISYNREKGLIYVLPKLQHYFLSHLKKSDYDEFNFSSLSSVSNNLKYDINQNKMFFEGVEKITLSKKNNMIVYPKEGKTTLQKNRNVKLLGDISVGNFDFKGVDLLFNYNNYKLDLLDIDTLKMLSKKNAKDSYNYLYNIGGDLFINHPKNKSSIRSLAQYPYFVSDKSTKIYFDMPDEYGTLYDSSFYFSIDQFRIDSLDKSSLPKFEFPGTFYSNNILQPLEAQLITMPDNSFGFDKKIDKNGIGAYNNKIKTYNNLLMDSTGLYVKGNIKYQTTMIFSDKIRLFPDSLYGYMDKAFMYEGPSLNKLINYPSMELENSRFSYFDIEDEHFYVDYDSAKESKFSAYDSKVNVIGDIYISPKSVISEGKIITNGSNFLSDQFNLTSRSIISKNTEVELNYLGYPQNVLKSNNVEFKYDIAKNTINLVAEYFDEKNYILPFYETQTSLLNSSWEIDKNTIVFTNPKSDDINPSFFYSSSDKFTEWNFSAQQAEINLDEKTLNIKQVPELQIADAYIIPNQGKITIKENFIIEPLYDAELILDTISEYHKFIQSSVVIESRDKFEGRGIYEYINFNQDTFKIPFSEFELKFSGDGKELAKKTTFSSGKVDKSSPILMEPGFDFFGKIELFANNEQLLFNGTIIPSEVEDFNVEEAISFNDYFIPGDELTLNISENDDFFISSISKNDNDLFFDFFKNPVKKRSLIFFNPSGQLSYDSYNNQYLIETKEKREQEVYNGNSLLYNPNDRNLSFEGKVNMIDNNNNFKIHTSMTGMANTDSMKIESEALIVLDVNIKKSIIDNLGLAFVDVIETYGAPIAHDNEQELLSRLSDLIGNENTINYENMILSEYKSLSESDQLLNGMFVFANSNFSWSPKHSTWHNTSVLNLSNIGVRDINASMDGFMEIKYKNDYNYDFNLFLQPTPELWFYMSYDGNVLKSYSSDIEFNLDISEITASSKGRYLTIETVDEEYVLSFINKFRLQYFNIAEPYDLKSPSDTFLEDEIFKTVSDDDDGF